MKDTPNIPDISALLQSIEEVRMLCQKQGKIIIDLRASNARFLKENSKLKREIVELKDQLRFSQQRKDSTNSSMALSSNINKSRNTNSLREVSTKKAGGQKGHKGTTLRIQEHADVTTNYFPESRNSCGISLSVSLATFSGRRQYVDLLIIRQIVTEHRIYSKQCICGHCTKSEYPLFVETPVSYGPNIQSLVAYMGVRQYLPVKRHHEFLKKILNVNLSQGGISFLTNKMAKKSEDEYLKIKTSVMNSSVIGADETGANINGVNHWYWTFQDTKNTYIGIHKNRGYEAKMDLFGNNSENSTLVIDCWASCFKTNTKNHQLCLAHLQRELIGLSQKYTTQTWTRNFNYLLFQAINFTKQYKKIPPGKIKEIHLIYEKLMEPKELIKCKAITTFFNRMIKYKKYLFNFFNDNNIPRDNNVSERAIRNVKVKQKVSGFFKFFRGAENYAISHSYKTRSKSLG